MGDPTPVDLPPGMVLTDSDLVSMSAYVDGDNVRFHRGKPQAIGGNKRISTAPIDGPCRGTTTWNDLTARQLIAAGTPSKLWVMSNANYTPFDITPADVQAGSSDPTLGYGWGAGQWNRGAWNRPRLQSTFSTDPRYWSVQNFGKILLANPSDGKLYSYDPSSSVGTLATLVVNVSGTVQPPPIIRGFWVTSERFVVCFGCTGPGLQSQNLMRLYWSAQGDYTDWNVSHTPVELANLLGAAAGSRQLTLGTRIMAGCDMGQQVSLIWTDAGLYTHTYTGDQNTFNTVKIAEKCGLLSRYGWALAGATAYWMSNNSFWMWQSGSLTNIPNQDDIRQYFFGQLRGDNYSSKNFAYFHEAYNEVWFCAVPLGSSEPTLAVVYMIDDQKWYKTTIPSRSAETSLLGLSDPPLLFGEDGYLYQHETGVDDNGAPLLKRLRTGLMEVASGAVNLQGLSYMPDMQKQVGNMSLTMTTRDRTRQRNNQPILEQQTKIFGPNDKQIDYRIAGRELMLEWESNVLGGDFRFGANKIEMKTAGKRR